MIEEEKEKGNESYLNLLNTHIDLLCKLKQFDKILPCLKNRPFRAYNYYFTQTDMDIEYEL